MAAITGPKIQLPNTQGMTPDLASFHHSVQQTTFNLSRSGPTASRPTSALAGRWVGMPFFDTTLGLVVSLKSVNPDVWVRYDGTPV